MIRALEGSGDARARSTLAALYRKAWPQWYGPDGPGNAEAELDRCRRADRLPLCLVARAAGRIVGTASLKTQALGADLYPGPWLAGLVVVPARRRQGIGNQLVAAVEGAGRRFGHSALYAVTSTARGLIERRGWCAIGTVQAPDGTVLDVFRRDLAP